MSRPAILWTALVPLLGAAVLVAQQQPRRQALDAEFRLASRLCQDAVDSGSLEDALTRLSRIAVQVADFPGLKALQDKCNETRKKLLGQEAQTFEEAKTAYYKKALDEARYKFQSLANRKTQQTAEARRFLALMAGEGPGASQQDYDTLELAKRHIQANNHDKARPLLEGLIGKGSSLAAEAKKYLDHIDLRSKSDELMQQGIRAVGQRRYEEALNTFQKVQAQDPGYPKLNYWIPEAQRGLSRSPQPAQATDAASLERGKSLFSAKSYSAALEAFRQAQSGRPDSVEIPSWIQKTEAAMAEATRQERRDRMVNDARALLRKKDYARARVQLLRASASAPNDEEIVRLLAQAQAGMKQSGQAPTAEERSAALAVLLEDGVRQFYAGNFPETRRLLEQYVKENGKNLVLAYFYLGAVASTEFFLEGEKDREKEALARQLFAKGRRADKRFEPPREWISPKIVGLYERTAAAP